MRRNKVKQTIVNFYNKDNLRSDKITTIKKKKLQLIKQLNIEAKKLKSLLTTLKIINKYIYFFAH